MKTYQDLAQHEKEVFDSIETIFVRHPIKKESFVRVLGVLINKLKGGKRASGNRIGSKV